MTVKAFIRAAKRLMSCSIQANYSRGLDMTPRARYKGMAHTFDQILDLARASGFEAAAKAYYEQRRRGDAALERLQTQTKKEIERCIQDTDCMGMHKMVFRVVPASSFSAKTHLTGESDIDFAVLVKRIDTNKVVCASNGLGGCGFIYNDLRNPESPRHVHWVFQKFVNGVELEAKVRDDDGFKEILKLHDYLDHHMSQDTRELVTYVKHLFKTHDRKGYDEFKQFYYSQAGYHGGTKELLYPLR